MEVKYAFSNKFSCYTNTATTRKVREACFLESYDSHQSFVELSVSENNSSKTSFVTADKVAAILRMANDISLLNPKVHKVKI